MRSSDVRIERGSIKIGFEDELFGPVSVVVGIKKEVSKAVKDAYDGVKLNNWTKFARSRPDCYFAYYKGDLLIQFGQAAHVTNLGVTMTEEEASAFPEKYGVCMADPDKRAQMIAKYEALPEQEKEREQKFNRISEQLQAKPSLHQRVIEVLDLQRMYPEGLIAVVDGRVLFKVTQGEIADLTPDPDAGVAVEAIEQYLEEFEALVLRGQEAQQVLEEFNRQDKKPTPMLLRLRGKICELQEEVPGVRFLQEESCFLVCKPRKDGPDDILRLKFPEEMRESIASLFSELNLPIVTGEEARHVRRRVAAANKAEEDVKDMLARVQSGLS